MKQNQRHSVFSQRAVHRIGSQLRNKEDYDESIFDEFMVHCSYICEEVQQVVENSFNSIIGHQFEKVKEDAKVEPDSQVFRLSARVKTLGTLVEKLKRMPNYPLENIQDIAGIRLDCDMTLREQTKLSEIIKENLKICGAKKVEIKDYRDQPHSGYRAIHLRISSNAGKAELQVRTALQSQWANLYEVAGDIYGRSIRYTEFGEKVPNAAKNEVSRLQAISDDAYKVEQNIDAEIKPFAAAQIGGKSIEFARQRRKETYDALDFELRKLQQTQSVRATIGGNNVSFSH